MKTFSEDFNKFVNLVDSGENFSFARFSDGEVFVMQNKTLVLAENHFNLDGRIVGGRYIAEEQKEFVPEKHSFYRDKLIEAFQFKKKNYFKGVSCRCCIGEADFKYQLDLHGGDDDSLTWSNLFINANYPSFVKKMLPSLKGKKIVLVCNKIADLEILKTDLELNIVKDFRVGSNCMVNDYGLIEEMKEWISKNDIEDHVFLFSAASLSNYLSHQLFEFNDKNTYMDIGSTLNPVMKMEGWKASRDYLISFWMGRPTTYGNQVCIW